MKAIWNKFAARLRVCTRYTRSLEEEIARLRVENRALVNSILGVAGMPPLRAAARTAASRVSRRENAVVAPEASTMPAPSSAEIPLRRVRRRSWQQIGRALEIEDAKAARRERESNAETFPPPRRVLVRGRP